MYNHHDVEREREREREEYREGQRKWEGEMNEKECVLIKKLFYSKTWKELEREGAFFFKELK